MDRDLLQWNWIQLSWIELHRVEFNSTGLMNSTLISVETDWLIFIVYSTLITQCTMVKLVALVVMNEWMNEMIIHVLLQHVDLLFKTIREEKQHSTIVMSFNSMNEKWHNYCCGWSSTKIL